MKTTASAARSFAALAAAACLALIATAPARASEIVTPTQNVYIWDAPPFNGTGDDRDFGGTMIVGEMDSGAVQRLTRAIIHFTLPDLPDGQTLQSATLRLYVTNVVNQDGALLDATLYHSQTRNDTTVPVSLYQDSGYTSTGLSALTPGTAIGSWVEIDVTSWVALDYQYDAPASIVSSFRLQVDGLEFVANDKAHRYSIAGLNDSTNKPQLVLDMVPIPEPATATLSLAAVAAAFAWCRRRR